eukprot:438818-Hanusia_phi.AAC.2
MQLMRRERREKRETAGREGGRYEGRRVRREGRQGGREGGGRKMKSGSKEYERKGGGRRAEEEADGAGRDEASVDLLCNGVDRIKALVIRVSVRAKHSAKRFSQDNHKQDCNKEVWRLQQKDYKSRPRNRQLQVMTSCKKAFQSFDRPRKQKDCETSVFRRLLPWKYLSQKVKY